ncbi:MAG TPA: hypothetical protein PKA37_09835 [Planctomycetota bacterium]|nr:hypothetical protein [Planctomycetota bacterium]
MSRLIWLLVPMALVGLLGIGIPVSQDLFASDPASPTIEDALVPLPPGTLEDLEERSRTESRPEVLRALTNLIREVRVAKEQQDGQIPSRLLARVQAVLGTQPRDRESGK